MRNSVRFIHAADIHLGSFLHLSNKVEGAFKNTVDNAVSSAFERIVNAAIENAVDFILISGDTFENEKRSISADNFFYNMMNKLKGIEVFIICGNHDPYREWKDMFKLPENAHMIAGDMVEKLDFIKNKTLNAQIEGISYRMKKEGRNVIEQFKYKNEEISTIALLHTQLDASNDSYMPASISDLMSISGISYWALGHIHKFKLINKNKPCIVYPGIPQGRDFGEEGIGGCLLAEIDDVDDVRLKYIPVSSVVFQKIEINIEEHDEREMQDITDIEDLIIEKARELVLKNLSLPHNMDCGDSFEGVIKGFIVQWILKGRGSIQSLISEREDEIGSLIASNINEKLKDLNENYFIHTDSVLFRISNKLPHVNELKKVSPIYKELEDTLKLFSENIELKKELINVFGDVWRQSGNMEDEDPFKFYINDEVFNDIIRQAQELIVEKLYERWGNIED